MTTPRVFRTAAAARYIGVSESAMEKMRRAGCGPRSLRLGGRSVGYAVEDLDRWVDEQRDSTDNNSAA